jgi:hypothetical protein
MKNYKFFWLPSPTEWNSTYTYSAQKEIRYQAQIKR